MAYYWPEALPMTQSQLTYILHVNTYYTICTHSKLSYRKENVIKKILRKRKYGIYQKKKKKKPKCK